MPLGLACNAVGWPWSVAATLALGMAHDAEVAGVVKLGVIYAEGDVGAFVVTLAQELGVSTRCAGTGDIALAALGRTLAADATAIVPSDATGDDASGAVKNEVSLARHAVLLERPDASGAACRAVGTHMVGDGDDRYFGGIVVVVDRVQVLPCRRQRWIGALGTLRNTALTMKEVDAAGCAVLCVSEAATAPAAAL